MPTVKKNEYADDVAPSTDPETLLEDFGYDPVSFEADQLAEAKKLIQQYLDEGMSPDIAVGKAVALAAPDLRKKRFMAGGGQFRSMVGGNYTAIDNGDGTYQIVDIPIFAEVPAGAKRNTEEIGEEWMVRALRQNRLRAGEGHLPPVHIYHSDEHAVKPRYAGKFQITRLGAITYEGETVPALFANIVDIPKDVFALIEKGFLPYRSVEVHDWSRPEIDSLALMPTDVPFFRMAMTTIGKVVRRGEKAQDIFKIVNEGPARRYVPQGKGAMILFRFKEEPMSVKKTTKFANTKVRPGDIDPDEEAGPVGSGSDVGPTSGTKTPKGSGGDGGESGLTSAGKSSAGSSGVKGSDTAPGGTEDAEVHMDDGIPPAPGSNDGVTGNGGNGNDEMLSLLRMIAQKLGCGGNGASPEAAPAAPPESPEQDLAPVSGMRAAHTGGANMNASGIQKILLRATAPLQAEIAQLKARNAKADKASRVAAMVDKAVAEDLAGYNIDDDLAGSLFRAAEQGEAFLADVVGLIQRTAPVEPPSDEAELEAVLMAGPEGETLNKFCSTHPGPQNAEWVRMQASEHQAWVQKSGSDVTLEQWLETNWKAAQGATMTAGRR